MVVWLWLTLACAVTGAIVVARTALPSSWPRVELAVLAAIAFAPATYNYWHGQINPVIFLLLAISYWAYVRDRQVTAGVLLGLAAGIKIAPVIFLIILIRRRWWRGTAAMASTGVVTLALGTLTVGGGATITFFSKVFPGLNRATGWIYDQSLGGAISRLAVPRGEGSRVRAGDHGDAAGRGHRLVPALRSPHHPALLRAGPGRRAGVARGAVDRPRRRGGAGRLRTGRPPRDLRPQHERHRRDQPDSGLVALPPALLAALRERAVDGHRPGPEAAVGAVAG
jgi:hypothetical protein